MSAEPKLKRTDESSCVSILSRDSGVNRLAELTDYWAPSAPIENLRLRAGVLASIRRFFAKRQIMEVETPQLARFGVTDPHMQAIMADNPGVGDQPYYLQTSPEYAMKRLLMAGSGPIYQLCKAFRKDESGRLHNPEFTLLEWYRPGFNQFQLMDEVAALVEQVLAVPSCRKLSYRSVFQQYLQIDPHVADCQSLKRLAQSHIDVQMQSDNRDDWLNVLLTGYIEPQFNATEPLFIYDYPASQAALATVCKDHTGTNVAQRFELYIGPVELANGYYELTDFGEHKRRFRQDQQQRQEHGQPNVASDEFLLAALAQQGLAACAGVAMGVDRLVMLALNQSSIGDVLAFPVARA